MKKKKNMNNQENQKKKKYPHQENLKTQMKVWTGYKLLKELFTLKVWLNLRKSMRSKVPKRRLKEKLRNQKLKLSQKTRVKSKIQGQNLLKKSSKA